MGEQKANLVPVGDITASNTDAFRGELLNLINKGANEITIDFLNVAFIDSSGIGTLAATFNQLSKNGGLLRIENASKDIMKLFTIMHLNKRFNVSLKQ